jgi:endonuclease I
MHATKVPPPPTYAIRSLLGHSVRGLTLEHVVPASVLRRASEAALADMHNMIILPAHLNSARGCRMIVDPALMPESTTWRALPGAHHRWHGDYAGAWVSVDGRYFAPPPSCRGAVARAVAHMCLMHGVDPRGVMDPRAIVAWATSHPPSAAEVATHERVAAVMCGFRNVFVDVPDMARVVFGGGGGKGAPRGADGDDDGHPAAHGRPARRAGVDAGARKRPRGPGGRLGG